MDFKPTKELMQAALTVANGDEELVRQAFFIFKLCQIYQEGTGKKITLTSLSDRLNVLDFIEDVLPILKEQGLDMDVPNKLKLTCVECYALTSS